MSAITSSAVSERVITLPRSGRRLTYELARGGVKNLNLRVRRDGSVRLSVPLRTTAQKADAFLISREDWLLSALDKMRGRAATDPIASGEVGNSLPYLGGTLTIRWESGAPAAMEADPGHRLLTVRLPDPADKDLRREAVRVFEKAETERLILPLIAHHFPPFAARGVPAPAHIRIKHLTSRFGSCAPATKSLNFAARLCEYPSAFIEYVVVHELCHFLVPNHSAAFWQEVARILPDYREREKIGKR